MYSFQRGQFGLQRVKKVIFQSSNALADLFFPNSCFGCGIPDTLICVSCSGRIPLLQSQLCFSCQRNKTRLGEACYHCVSRPSQKQSLDAIFAATCYGVPVIKNLIHAYKYQFVKTLSKDLGWILAQAVEKSALPAPNILVPVPLHQSRLRYRGFNQSALLASALKEHVDFVSNTPLSLALEREKKTLPQQKTHSKEERVLNLTNAFRVTDAKQIKNAVIWLIDDVSTTGSTLHACAEALKKAGAKAVYGVVLARD